MRAKIDRSEWVWGLGPGDGVRACARVRGLLFSAHALIYVYSKKIKLPRTIIASLSVHSIVRLYVDTHVDVLSEPADQFRELPGSSCHQPLLVSLIHPLIQLGCALHSSGNVELVI